MERGASWTVPPLSEREWSRDGLVPECRLANKAGDEAVPLCYAWWCPDAPRRSPANRLLKKASATRSRRADEAGLRGILDAATASSPRRLLFQEPASER